MHFISSVSRYLSRPLLSALLALSCASCGDAADDSTEIYQSPTLTGSGGSSGGSETTSTSSAGGTTNATSGSGGSSSGGSGGNGGQAATGSGTTRGATSTGTGSGGATTSRSTASSAGGSGGSSTGTDTSTTGSNVPGRSNGCGKAPGSSGASSLTIDLGGRQGSYVLSLPRSYDENTPYALVFGFHGAGSTGAGLREWFYVEETSNDEAVFVYPDGFNNVWEAEVYNRDFSFEEALRDAVMEDYCIDTNSVFAFGFSYGGWATTQMACSRPDLIHGVASVAGGGPQGQCMGPIPMMVIHGTNDPAEPIRSSEATRDTFLEVNQCDSGSTPVDPMPCVSYAGCAEKLHWCPHDGEHNIPFEFDGAIWAFFSSLR